MTVADPALTHALDDLTLQVHRDNVLAVHKVFREHAGDLQESLLKLAQDSHVGLCGGDPVSKEAADSFNAKVTQLLEVHWAHQRELVVAAEHLLVIARTYGFTEADIEQSLRGEGA